MIIQVAECILKINLINAIIEDDNDCDDYFLKEKNFYKQQLFSYIMKYYK